jgi:hypothetical protein
MGDNDAMSECGLEKFIENVPGGYVVIGDAAYTPTEHMAPIFSGVDKSRPDFDNFNFYASQCRIRIEMTFGLMTKKSGILQRLLTTKLTNDKWLIICIARLHNFVINERLSSGQQSAFKVGDRAVDAALALVERSHHQTPETEGSVRHRGNSTARLLMVQRVKDKGLERPAKNTIPSDPFEYTYK